MKGLKSAIFTVFLISNALETAVVAETTKITYSNGVTVYKNENAVVESQNGVLNIVSGVVRIVVTKLTSSDEPSLQFKTKDTTMGVRGTEFFVAAQSKGTQVCTLSGLIEVSTKNGTQPLAAGQGIVISKGAQSQTIRMDENQMRWWIEQTAVEAKDLSPKALAQSESLWIWGDRPLVNQLQLSTLPSKFLPLGNSDFGYHPGIGFFLRGIQQNNLQDTHTSIGSFRTNFSMATSYKDILALHAESVVVAKSGYNNNDKAGIQLQQLVALFGTDKHQAAVGRMELDFGKGLMIGNDPWNTIPRKFDGALYTLRTENSRLRVFFGSLDDRVASTDFKDFLYTLYFDYAPLMVDFYGIAEHRQGAGSRANRIDTSAKNFDGTFYTLGIRRERLLDKKWIIQTEMAIQFGDIGINNKQQHLVAGIAHSDFGLIWKLTDSIPIRSTLNILVASGESNPDNGTYSGFQPLFPNGNQFLGFSGVLTQIQNILKYGTSHNVHYSIAGLNFENKLDFFFARRNTNDSSSARHLGAELDLQWGLKLKPNWVINIGMAHLFPGEAFQENSPTIHRGFIMTSFQY